MKKKQHFLIQFVCILTVLIAILLQGFTHVVKMEPLSGYIPDEQPVELTFKTYYDGSFQNYLTDHAKRNSGFREPCIRSYNQCLFSLFGKSTNDNIIRGKDRELFLNIYLDDIIGKTLWDYYPSIEEAQADARKNVQETLRLIDTLKRFDIDFLFVFAPSKTAVYPEKMPQSYQEQMWDFSLEEYYIELFKENGIPHIDFLNYFKAIRDTVAYPLYARTGTHWAESTIPMVSDSIFRKLEELTGLHLPSIDYLDDNITTDYSVQDGELEASMNLLFPLDKPALPRPICTLKDTISADRPNLLVIGDSYANQLVFSSFGKAFNNWDWWAYNRDIHSSRERFNWRRLKEEFDAVTVLQDADIVMAIFTAPMLYDYMFEFPRTAQELLEKGYFNEEEAMETVIKMIKDEPEWYDGVVKQAEERDITIEECLTLNAKYYLDCQNRKLKRPVK